MRAAESERRSYSSPRRRQQAAETRAAVLAAAAAQFSERGWAATGMRDVARAAEVSVETIYSGFGSKPDLLMAAIDMAVAGDESPAPIVERAEFAAIGVGGLAERAAAAARLLADVHARAAGLVLALREAAAAEPGLAARMRDMEERRRSDVERGAALVAGRPLAAQERDGVWAIAGVEVYRLLTGLSGWSYEDYRSWLADVLVRLLSR